MNKSNKLFFQDLLLIWYSKNGRKFPWRNKSATDYIKIIAEILLQRTSAPIVAKHFPSFIEEYPSWQQLSVATEEELIETLKPIGLYNQKGNGLYKLTKEIIKHNYEFPKKHKELIKLPLFGEYITNAYELIILQKRVPLIDGNMKRLLSRFFIKDTTDSPNKLKTLAYTIVKVDEPIKLNWAILDFASLI